MLRTVIAATFLFRHFDTLTEYCDRLIALDPTDFMSYLNKAMADVYARGDTASALAALRQGETMAGNVPRPLAWGYAEAGPAGWERWERMSLADLGPALASDTVDYYFWRALIESAQGRRGVAGAFADSVIDVVGKLKLVGWKAAVARAQRGYAYALRGDRRAAERDIAQAELGLASELPAVREQSREELIAALAEAGDFERALAMSRRLLEVPTGVTRYGLRLSPAFAKLWGRLEFERLVADTTLPP
jgi:tetratricopeptide (TPR) repeat protein